MSRVRVADPSPSPLFAPFVGDVVYINGDSTDVRKPGGDVAPFPSEWCRPVVGRPPKDPDDRRNRERIKVSRNEQRRLKAWATSRGFRSVADMVLDGCP